MHFNPCDIGVVRNGSHIENTQGRDPDEDVGVFEYFFFQHSGVIPGDHISFGRFAFGDEVQGRDVSEGISLTPEVDFHHPDRRYRNHASGFGKAEGLDFLFLVQFQSEIFFHPDTREFQRKGGIRLAVDHEK